MREAKRNKKHWAFDWLNQVPLPAPLADIMDRTVDPIDYLSVEVVFSIHARDGM